LSGASELGGPMRSKTLDHALLRHSIHEQVSE
jgi:hypothetical protein